MIKCGNRKNLIYPIMLVISIFLTKVVEELIERNFSIGKYVLLFDWLLGKTFFGIIIVLYNNCKSKSNKNEEKKFVIKLMGIEEEDLNLKESYKDGKFKISVLIFLATFFDYFVSIIRTFFIRGDTKSKSIKNRIRCCQIFFSGILCYFTIRINLYNHHKFSLILIFIGLSIIITSEIIFKENGTMIRNYYPLILTIVSNLGRTFLDTTEKYLFDSNNINIFTVMMIEGGINIISLYIYYYFKGYPDQFENLDFKKPKESSININKFIFILLIFLYFIFTGLRNIYRVTTIKFYSPMVRALTEAIFDPFLFGYKQREYWKEAFYWINISCLVLMVFSSLVFTEFIILYCCNLEYYTHLEITKRGRITNDTISENSSSFGEYILDEEEKDEKINNKNMKAMKNMKKP